MGAHFVIVMAQEILHTKKKTLWRGHKKNRGQKKDMGGRQRGRFVKKRGAPGGHYTHSTRVSTYTQKKKRRKKSFFFPSSPLLLLLLGLPKGRRRRKMFFYSVNHSQPKKRPKSTTNLTRF